MNSLGGNSSAKSGGYQTEEVEIQMVTCPMCNGSGVFEYMPGDVMAPRETCSACNGNGVCDVNTAQQVMQAMGQVDAMMGGGASGYGGSGGYNTGGSGRSVYEIQYDLDKAYELLEDMERNYANCDGIVASSQYPGMIADQKERIRQLEAELRNAQ